MQIKKGRCSNSHFAKCRCNHFPTGIFILAAGWKWRLPKAGQIFTWLPDPIFFLEILKKKVEKNIYLIYNINLQALKPWPGGWGGFAVSVSQICGWTDAFDGAHFCRGNGGTWSEEMNCFCGGNGPLGRGNTSVDWGKWCIWVGEMRYSSKKILSRSARWCRLLP